MIKTLDLELENYKIEFLTRNQRVTALRETSIKIEKNKVTGIIGESGSGKSVLGLGLLGLTPSYSRVMGEVKYGNQTITDFKKKEREIFTSETFGYIPQNPGESLNPIKKIGKQMEEILRKNYKNKEVRKKRSIELLNEFGFSNPNEILNAYPFQLSGGMQQRVLTSLAIGKQPKWIIADEPTKGLDENIKFQVLDVFKKLKDKYINSMLIITHDIDLANILCDKIIIMYSGEVIEIGEDVLNHPIHPYTQGFLESLPQNGMKPLKGKSLSATENQIGCRFSNRCKYKKNSCLEKNLELFDFEGRKVRCLLYDSN